MFSFVGCEFEMLLLLLLLLLLLFKVFEVEEGIIIILVGRESVSNISELLLLSIKLYFVDSRDKFTFVAVDEGSLLVIIVAV